MKKIILASTSPRRKELLKNLRITFQVVASDYEEDMSLPLKPLALARRLSKEKAQAVARKYTDHIIIAADTFVVLGNEILGKPHTSSEARKMLMKISNKTLSVVTGFTIIEMPENKTISKAIETKVQIKKLTNSEISNYIKTGEPLDKAGAFAIQGLGASIVKKIEGDYHSAMGLPLYPLAQALLTFGVRVL